MIDVLGIAPDGRLEICELRVNRSGRQTLAQAIDDPSRLDTEPLSELDVRIVGASNRNGVPPFKGFGQAEARSPRPARLAIVASEANAALQRTVWSMQRLGLDTAVEPVRHEVFALPQRDILAQEYGVSRQRQAARETVDSCFEGRRYRMQHRRRGLNYCLHGEPGTVRSLVGVYVNAHRDDDLTLALRELAGERDRALDDFRPRSLGAD